MGEKEFSNDEWQKIFDELATNASTYGLPERRTGSAVIGSFNIRKLGSADNRSPESWKFLGQICQQFDLLAIQEAMDNMEGVRRLKQELGDEYNVIVSNTTGVFPGDQGLGERLVYFYNSYTVERGEVISDLTYDRSKVNQIILENLDTIIASKQDFEEKMKEYEAGDRKTKPRFDPNVFLSFIRQPFLASFKIKEIPGTLPYEFMTVNAHLIYGKSKDRWNEFCALMDWLRERVVQKDKSYFPSFILLGDLNLDFDNPEKDYSKMESYMKNIDAGTPDEVKVNFPFLEVHPNQTEQFTSNVKLTQRYDQIGLFFRDDDGKGKGFPTHSERGTMGKDPLGPDFGVFNFTELFSKAVTGKTYKELSGSEQKALVKKYENKVSDHIPLWLRLKLPENEMKRRNTSNEGNN